MDQGRQQTERITSRQAGSVRQAANDQERERVNGPGSTHKGKCSEMLARAKQDFAVSASESAA